MKTIPRLILLLFAAASYSCAETAIIDPREAYIGDYTFISFRNTMQGNSNLYHDTVHYQGYVTTFGSSRMIIRFRPGSEATPQNQVAPFISESGELHYPSSSDSSGSASVLISGNFYGVDSVAFTEKFVYPELEEHLIVRGTKIQ